MSSLLKPAPAKRGAAPSGSLEDDEGVRDVDDNAVPAPASGGRVAAAAARCGGASDRKMAASARARADDDEGGSAACRLAARRDEPATSQPPQLQPTAEKLELEAPRAAAAEARLDDFAFAADEAAEAEEEESMPVATPAAESAAIDLPDVPVVRSSSPGLPRPPEVAEEKEEAAEDSSEGSEASRDLKPDLQQLRADIDATKQAMAQNIDALLERGEKMDALLERTDELEQAAAQFHKPSRRRLGRPMTDDERARRTTWLFSVLVLVVYAVALVQLMRLQVGAFSHPPAHCLLLACPTPACPSLTHLSWPPAVRRACGQAHCVVDMGWIVAGVERRARRAPPGLWHRSVEDRIVTG
jgi:hypothetical protein